MICEKTLPGMRNNSECAMAKVILIDRYDDGGFDIDRYREAKSKNKWCLELYGVAHVVSYVSADRKCMVCVFEAPDVEAVRQMSRRLGYSYEDVWAATAVD